ncbi:MAG: IclR family transcriptional regulator [Burkholderiaceae bacterium]|nr:IclR family transcriptional regulator [Burkholderiaceae bacterium]
MTESESDVKSARRVLQIFQLFAEMRRAASLAVISKRLNLPKSSCLALLKTLESNGYLYCLNDSHEYYPTRRIADEAQTIVAHDPLLSHLRPVLQALSQETGETVFLAKRTGHLSHYLEVVQSGQTLRYAASVGEKRPLHIGAAGQALLAAMDDAERDVLIDQLELEQFSPKTITDTGAYKRLIAQGKARGWFMSTGGYQAEVASIGNFVRINGEAYAVVVGGPTKRLTDSAESIGRTVAAYCRKIEAGAGAAVVAQG